MRAIVGKDIVIENYTSFMEDTARRTLTFSNPEYVHKEKLGHWLGNTPRELRMYSILGSKLILPFGMLPTIFRMKNLFDDGIYNCFSDLSERIDYKSWITPYAYQEVAVQQALKLKQGVIVAPCGAGKTQIGLEIAARIGGKTLWITHTQDLLNQSMTRAMSNFGLTVGDYGTITAGKVCVGNVMTFATVQTLAKADLRDFYEYWDTIIIDECHHAVGTPTKMMMFYHVISSLQARHKFGLTATPTRADGLTDSMYRLIGDKIYEISKADVQNTTCPVKVVLHETGFVPEEDYVLNSDGTLNYMKLINSLTINDKRTEKIVEDVTSADGSCLVLTDRVEHVETIKDMLTARGISALSLKAVNSKRGKEERAGAIEALNAGLVKVLVATFHIAKEGLDVPSLRNIFFCTPQKNDAIITQSAGRVARKADGKDFGTVHDYVDDFGMLKSWSKRRNKIYEKNGFLFT